MLNSRGRKPLGKRPLTNAEKQARHRAKVKAELAGFRAATVPTWTEDVARERFLSYVTEKLAGEWDTTAWEFWTYLFEQAKGHRLDHSGYGSIAFQQDRDAAREARAGIPEKPLKQAPIRKGCKTTPKAPRTQ